VNRSRISIKETLQFAVKTALKKAPLLYAALLVSLVLLAVYMFVGIVFIMLIGMGTPPEAPGQTLPATPLLILLNPFRLVGFAFYTVIVTGYLLFIFLGIGYINIAFDLYDTGTSSIKRLFSGWPVLFKSAFLYFLYFLGKTITYALFFVPGLIFDSNFMLASYFMVDKKYGIHESFKKSNRASRGSRLKILAVMYAPLGIAVLLALPAKLLPALEILVSIALFLSVPVRILSAVSMCRQLQAPATGLEALGAPEEHITNLVP
jgi:hypothetical protein